MRAWRDAPASAILLVGLSVYGTQLFYAERHAVMEQRLTLASESSRAVTPGPLPRYSLGGSPGTYFLEFEEEGPWVPAGYHRDVSLDWSELDGIRVMAEVLVWVRALHDSAPREGWGQIRVTTVTDGTVVAEGPRLQSATAELQRLRIPEATGQHTYRVEVFGSQRAIATSGDIVLAR